MSREPQDVEWFNGRIDAAKVREFARHDLRCAAVDEFFVCGPGTMGEDIPRALGELGAKGASTSSTSRRWPAGAAGAARRAKGAGAAGARPLPAECARSRS